MAKPAFIYAFDNLGPQRFTELCGLLLASRYKGFLLGGVGPDGGVDGEIDTVIGEWRPEVTEPLLLETVAPGQLVLFQFKHKTVARVGQQQSRENILSLYKCRGTRVCELHRDLILGKKPATYVLVTNVEVNSHYREKFIQQCGVENPDIASFQIVGLDELETWIQMEQRLGQLFFPTIFGEPRYELAVSVYHNAIVSTEHPTERILTVVMANTGTCTSYVDSIAFRLIDSGAAYSRKIVNAITPSLVNYSNRNYSPIVLPGRKQQYCYDLIKSCQALAQDNPNGFPAEIEVRDELGSVYTAPIPDTTRKAMIAAMKQNIEAD